MATDVASSLIDIPNREEILEKFKPSELELFLFTYLQDDLTCAVPPFHRSLLRLVDGSSDVVVQAPRGMGKSILLTKGYNAYALCIGKANDVLICSASYPEAQRRIRILKHFFETHDMLRATFGIELGRNFRGKWTDDYLELKVQGRLCSIIGRGMTSQIRGIHPDLVIVDDPEDTEGAKSPLVRNTVYDVFNRSIIPTRNPANNQGHRAKIILIGTPINAEVLIHRAYENFEGRFKDFQRMRFKAIEDGDTEELTKVKPGQSIFPSRFPLQELERIRRMMGARAFAAEFLCNPMPDGTQMYFEEFFRRRYRSMPPEHLLFTAVSVDPARTVVDIKRGSQTAITCGSLDKAAPYDGDIYIRAARIGHMTPKERSREAVNMAIMFEAEYIFIEDLQRGAGATRAPSDMADLMRGIMHELGVGHQFSVVVVNPIGDKTTRADRIVPVCEQGRVLFPDSLAGDMYKLYQQLMLFPMGEHDDGADSFQQLIEQLTKFKTSKSSWPDRAFPVSKASYTNPSLRQPQGQWRMTPRTRQSWL